MLAFVGAFAESLRAIFQPCTFLLVVPVITAVTAARATWQTLVVACAAAIVGGWILVDNSWILTGAQLRIAALGVVAVLVVISAPELSGRLGRVGEIAQQPWGAVGGVGAITLTATLWWRPCVGSELGAILNASDDGIWAELIPMAAYMLGGMLPAAAIVAARYAIDPPERMLRRVAQIGAGLGGVVAMSLAAGQHGKVVETLTRWTLQ